MGNIGNNAFGFEFQCISRMLLKKLELQRDTIWDQGSNFLCLQLVYVIELYFLWPFIVFIQSLQCLRVRLPERSKFSAGEIQMFMSIDADRIVNLFNNFDKCGGYNLLLLCILDHIYRHLTLYKLFKVFLLF